MLELAKIICSSAMIASAVLIALTVEGPTSLWANSCHDRSEDITMQLKGEVFALKPVPEWDLA